jgi:hypothetical protein
MDLLKKVKLGEINLGLGEREFSSLSSISLSTDQVVELTEEQQRVLSKLDYFPSDQLPSNMRRRWLPDLDAGVEFLMFLHTPDICIPYKLIKHCDDGTSVFVNMRSSVRSSIKGSTYRWVYIEVQPEECRAGRGPNHDVSMSPDDSDSAEVSLTIKSRVFDDVVVVYQEGLSSKSLSKIILDKLLAAGWNKPAAAQRARSVVKNEVVAGRVAP